MFALLHLDVRGLYQWLPAIRLRLLECAEGVGRVPRNADFCIPKIIERIAQRRNDFHDDVLRVSNCPAVSTLTSTRNYPGSGLNRAASWYVLPGYESTTWVMTRPEYRVCRSTTRQASPSPISRYLAISDVALTARI